MPLKQSPSKKAFQHNVEVEMKAHPEDRDRNLAIAYSIKRKNAHKKASGGAVQSGSKDMNMAEGGEISANNERRPMPDNRYNDSKEASRNSGNKPPKNDSWTDSPTIKQAQDNNGRKVMPIKYPKMVPQNGFSTRMRDEESDLQSSASPGPYGKQPPEHDNEEDAKKSGHPVRDMEDQHNNKKPPYNKAIEDQYSQDMAEADMKRSSSYAAGGKVIDEDAMDLSLREDEAHMMSQLSPSESEGDEYALDHDEVDGNRMGPELHDMEDEHSTGRKPYAMGGSIQYKDAMENEDDEMELNPAHDHYSLDDSEMQPEDEYSLEHEDSMEAAEMHNQHPGPQDSDSDIDEEMMMALGGEILEDDADIHSHGSMDTHEDADQVDLSRNADEDANEEDQASFGALRKENYSESEGLTKMGSPRDSNLKGDDEESRSENVHDRPARVLSKMNRNRRFKQR